MEQADAFAWRFYVENATGFNRDFGMMPKLIADLGLGKLAENVLLEKLSLIHTAVLDYAEKKAREKMENGG